MVRICTSQRGQYLIWRTRRGNKFYSVLWGSMITDHAVGAWELVE